MTNLARVLLAAGLWIPVLPAAAQDTTPLQIAPAPSEGVSAPSGVPQIETNVVMVRVAGPWETADQKGFSRLVATASGGSLTLYVQWIAENGTIVETKQLEGGADAPQLALAAVRGDTGPADSAVYFDTPKDAQGFRETFVLIVGAPGEARFGPATN